MQEAQASVTDYLKPGDTIEVPGLKGFTITVLGIDRGYARLGIKGPRHVPVWRKEIWLQLKESDRG